MQILTINFHNTGKCLLILHYLSKEIFKKWCNVVRTGAIGKSVTSSPGVIMTLLRAVKAAYINYTFINFWHGKFNCKLLMNQWQYEHKVCNNDNNSVPNSLSEKNLLSSKLIDSSYSHANKAVCGNKSGIDDVVWELYYCKPLILIGHGLTETRWHETAIFFRSQVIFGLTGVVLQNIKAFSTRD